jgi:hypothetical protein
LLPLTSTQAPSGLAHDDEDVDADESMARVYFGSWASSAASHVKNKACVSVPDHDQVFVLHAETVVQGADILLASVTHLVQIPKPTCLPAIMAGFHGRHPQDVADYLHVNVKFEL